MSELVRLFANNLLPIFLAAGTGFLLAQRLKIPARPLSQATFYIFSPCLIFSLLTGSELNGVEIGQIVLFTVLVSFASGLLAWITGRILRFERKTVSAMVLTSMFTNAGNYGLALVLFAFGEEALSFASIYFVTNALLAYSAGSLIASLGSASLAKSLRNLLGVPALYAMLLGILLLATGWKLPLPIERAVNLLGDASVPMLLVVLGMQLQSARIKANGLPLAAASAVRLVGGPLLGVVFAQILGLSGSARQAGIIEAAMPAAVLNTVIATEYNLQPTFVSAVVFITTILSPLTLTPLLAYLGG